MKKMLIALILGLGISSVSFGMDVNCSGDGIEFEDDVNFELLSVAQKNKVIRYLAKEFQKVVGFRSYNMATKVSNLRPISSNEDIGEIVYFLGVSLNDLIVQPEDELSFEFPQRVVTQKERMISRLRDEFNRCGFRNYGLASKLADLNIHSTDEEMSEIANSMGIDLDILK